MFMSKKQFSKKYFTGPISVMKELPTVLWIILSFGNGTTRLKLQKPSKFRHGNSLEEFFFVFLFFRLNESWKRIFHQNFPLTHFSQDYPTLIGICHQFVENDDLFIPLTLTYRFEVLAKINRLTRISQNLAVNPFLRELRSFRQSFNAIIGLGLVCRTKKTNFSFFHFENFV